MPEHPALGLRRFDDRVGEGSGQPRLDSGGGEALLRVQPGVAIALEARQPESPGTLYVTTKKVVWLSDTDKSKGYAVDFPSVSLHAVSRDVENYPFPCLYAQIETGQDGDDASVPSDESSESLQLAKVTEMRLIPSDPTLLEALFDVFCESAELNPDPNRGQDGQNEWFFGDEQMDGLEVEFPWQFSDGLANPIGHSNGDYDLADAVHELQVNDEIFEDAEEDEPEQS